MDKRRIDAIAKGLAAGTTRRAAMVGLGAAGLASIGLLAVPGDAAAGCRQRCRRRCEGRKPKCQDNCEDRRCG